MKLAGICNYCDKPAKYSCQICGASVCEDHFDKLKGVCVSCGAGKR